LVGYVCIELSWRIWIFAFECFLLMRSNIWGFN
jgi:hypothetical protein